MQPPKQIASRIGGAFVPGEMSVGSWTYKDSDCHVCCSPCDICGCCSVVVGAAEITTHRMFYQEDVKLGRCCCCCQDMVSGSSNTGIWLRDIWGYSKTRFVTKHGLCETICGIIRCQPCCRGATMGTIEINGTLTVNANASELGSLQQAMVTAQLPWKTAGMR